MGLLVAVGAATLLASFFCSLCEAAFYTVTPTQIELLRKRKVAGAEKLAHLRLHFQQAIAAILTVNTIANSVGSAWLGAVAGAQYGDAFVGVAAGVMSFAILVMGEVFPKNLGVNYAVILAPRIAWPIQILIWLSWPFVKICTFLMSLMTRRRPDMGPNAEEIMVMTRLAFQEGRLRPHEARWVENALQLHEVKAYDLMTPRTVVYTLPADLRLENVKKHSEHWVHSRLPLTEDRDPDRILGMVYRREVFDAILHGKNHLTLRDLKHDIDFVPETMRGHQLLDKFITEKRHMVAVVDEYGGFEGVVTLEDVLECMLGHQIVDEHDKHANLQEFARQQAKKRHSRADGAENEPRAPANA